jgi:broad specificity phosphatase PhoE
VVDIVLVRHASTAWSGTRYCGVSDPPLSEAGRLEALRLARVVAERVGRDTRIVTSPSRRAVATATAIADAVGAHPVEVDDRWREADLGIAEGRTFDELAAIAPALAADLAGGSLAVDWPDGETHAALEARVASAWRDLAHAGDVAVVVTHAGPFMHALAIADGREIEPGDLVEPAAAVRVHVPADGPSTTSVLPSGT